MRNGSTGMSGKSVVSFDDLSLDDVSKVFEIADSIGSGVLPYFGKATGKIVATLFYEASTRTRLSFESAMQRLGGGVISAWDVRASSASKGESLADTVRVVGEYGDVIVIRHPWDGAARLAAEYAPVPVINAGDGSHEHPTQTLCDLYTLREHHGYLKGLNVALCGDLLNGRTVHSLAFALARFGANIIFVPGDGNDIPPHVLRRLERDYNARITRERLGILSALFDESPAGDSSAIVNAIYMTTSEPQQLVMSEMQDTTMEFRVASGESLSIYVTRRQIERGSGAAEAGRYPALNAKSLKASQFKDISILHPLPRIDELSPEMDKDPRSLYFRQSAIGIPIRMALLWLILDTSTNEHSLSKAKVHPYNRTIHGMSYSHIGFNCPNNLCVTNQEPEFSVPEFEIFFFDGYWLRCLYCDHETPGTYVGNIESKFFYRSDLLDRFLPPVNPDNVRFFNGFEHAEAAGFKQVSAKWNTYQIRGRDRGQWLSTVLGRLT